MREYLDLEFRDVGRTLPFDYNLERVIDDFIVLAVFIGNDFLPHLRFAHHARMQVVGAFEFHHEAGVELSLLNFWLREDDARLIRETIDDARRGTSGCQKHLRGFDHRIGNAGLRHCRNVGHVLPMLAAGLRQRFQRTGPDVADQPSNADRGNVGGAGERIPVAAIPANRVSLRVARRKADEGA